MADRQDVNDPPDARSNWLLPAVIVALLLTAAGWSLFPNDDGPAPVARDGGIIEQFPVEERATVGPLAGRTIEGGRFDSSTVNGQVVVYNVWGSWCSPCRKEAPDLKRLSEELHAQGVRFVGIDVKDNDASAVAFQREFDIKYPSISTADSGQALVALGAAVPLGAVPTTVVIDREGRAAARIVGIASYYTLKGLIDDVLTEGT